VEIPNFSKNFNRDDVNQISVQGNHVLEVSERFGVSTYSLYKWMKIYPKAASQASSVAHEAEKPTRQAGKRIDRVCEKSNLEQRPLP
jgi:transposase